MAKIYSFSEFIINTDFFIEEVKKNKIFVYPTDTIYWLGALYNEENAIKINTIKQRPVDMYLSKIAPDVAWIQKNYIFQDSEKIITEDNMYSYLERFHWVTFIFDPVIFWWVRLIKHPFQNFVKTLGEAFFSTSVNLSWQANCVSIDQISQDILPYIDYIIDDGVLSNKPSALVNLINWEVINR